LKVETQEKFKTNKIFVVISTLTIIGGVLGLVTHLYVKMPRPGDSEVTFSVFDQAATCYYQSNHSKVQAIPVKRVLNPNFDHLILN